MLPKGMLRIEGQQYQNLTDSWKKAVKTASVIMDHEDINTELDFYQYSLNYIKFLLSSHVIY